MPRRLSSEGWLPCPHCGCKDILVDEHFGEGRGMDHERDTIYSMACNGCSARVANRYNLEVMKADWNRRTSDAA